MSIELMPFLSFMFITTYTPGPNNISSASMGILYGYRKTLGYLVGISTGFFLVMMLCAFLSHSLLMVLPQAESYLRWVGAAYILWLAWSILRSGAAKADTKEDPQAFAKGFALQLFNPKVAVYGLTIYSTFLASIVGRIDYLALSAMILALNTFMAISTWAMFGAAIRSRLENETFRKVVNAVLAAMLVYTAISLLGVV
ncbi:LysE family transporter [Maridesulfovibrio sp.]|uniref:LysE family transporter n=1 Tax=Maridesulfovibrio sp. TaxID=2795000 RepID=UPI003BAB067E